MNHNTLQEFLDTAQIPEFKSTPKTFLEIAKQPHYENVISNIYAFFLDPLEEHGLDDLFINSLIRCLNEKKGSIWIEDFSEFEIHTEYSIKGGRIDILLLSGESAIIIENKIYHQLTNSLSNYSKKIRKEIGNQNSVYGLVLGLKEIKTNENNFVSLTHKELLQQVFEDIGAYMLNASDKYLTFLKDFYQNILNLSHKTMKKEDIEFYLKNQDKISDLIKIERKFKAFVKQEVESVCYKFEGLRLYSMRSGTNNERRLRYFESEKVKGLYLTIVFDGLNNKKKEIEIIIELWHRPYKNLRSNLSSKDDLKALINDKIELLDKIFEKDNKVWSQLSKYTFHLNDSDIQNLSIFIETKILELDMLKAFRILETNLLLFDNKKIK